MGLEGAAFLRFSGGDLSRPAEVGEGVRDGFGSRSADGGEAPDDRGRGATALDDWLMTGYSTYKATLVGSDKVRIMPKTQMCDMVILLPGIMGSVLQKDGRDLWALSGQAIWKALSSLGSSLEELKLEDNDPDPDSLQDGIQATRLVSGPYLVPQLSKIDVGGYSVISRLVTDYFKVQPGRLDDDRPANFFEFPYDWRRDNRVAAWRLKKLIDRRLPQWRNNTACKNAKLILIAHSMGGLVARYYLEVLEGWRDCKALITFGTPYRGSVNVLDFLVNGYKKLFMNLSEVARSFPSLYQLMPIYEMLEVKGQYRRVAETEGIPNLPRETAEQALAFHREIEDAVENHKNEAQYQELKTIPMVGTHQRTRQSARLAGGLLTAEWSLPRWIDPSLDGGDGTVPRLSATPIELSDHYRETFIAEKHGFLQSNGRVLSDLLERLRQMQSRGHSKIRGSRISVEAEERPAISLDLDDLYLAEEPVKLHANLYNYNGDAGPLRSRIEPVAAAAPLVESELWEEEDGWSLTLEGLASGLYRAEVRTHMAGPQAPSPVHDLFEVVG